MLSRIRKVFKKPNIHLSLPKLSFSFPRFRFPRISFSFPFRKTGMILGAINTFFLVTLGVLGLFVSYINPIPHITPYIPLHIATQLFDSVVYMQANLSFTIGISVGLIVLGFMLHATNFRAWWRAFKAAPMAVLKSPITFYRKATRWRDWIFAKIEYLNGESEKWKRAFNIAKSPYSFLRMMGLKLYLQIGLSQTEIVEYMPLHQKTLLLLLRKRWHGEKKIREITP